MPDPIEAPDTRSRDELLNELREIARPLGVMWLRGVLTEHKVESLGALTDEGIRAILEIEARQEADAEFLLCSPFRHSVSPMIDEPPPADTPVSSHVETRQLRLAEPDDVKDAIAFALRYNGRKRVDMAGERVAQIAAEHLLEHLQRSGFVIMHKPPAPLRPDQHYGPSAARAREQGPK